jgi:hypothetical protein
MVWSQGHSTIAIRLSPLFWPLSRSGVLRGLLPRVDDGDDSRHAAHQLVRGQERELMADLDVGRRPGRPGTGKPAAAAVSTLQVPNGGTFTMGTWSMTVAASWWLTFAWNWLVTTSWEGALPQVHCRVAPITTACGMMCSLRSLNGYHSSVVSEPVAVAEVVRLRFDD